MSIRIFATVTPDYTQYNTIIIDPAGIHEEASRLGARNERLQRFIFSRRGISKTATWEHLKIRYTIAPSTSCATTTTARIYLPVVSCRTLQQPGDVNDNRSLFQTSFTRIPMKYMRMCIPGVLNRPDGSKNHSRGSDVEIIIFYFQLKRNFSHSPFKQCV